MGNFSKGDHVAAATFVRELGVSWNPGQRYGAFVPKLLVPETYKFGFEATRLYGESKQDRA